MTFRVLLTALSLAVAPTAVGVEQEAGFDVDGRIAFRHVGYGDSALDGIVAEINSLLVKNELH